MGRAIVFLRPEQRPERVQWAVAHEIGEHYAWRVAERLGGAACEISPAAREQMANAFASRLLMPTDWFRCDAVRLEYDVPALKVLYGTASHESIAWRVLEVGPAAVVTVFDEGQVSRRRSNFGRTPPLTPAERACWHAVHCGGRPRRETYQSGAEDFAIQGWPVHEPGWRREILRMSSLA